MNACVERQATTARFPRASSSPIAFSRCVLPRPLFPTSTSGLYFFPGRSRAARAALTATWFDAPTAKAASGNAADGPGGGAPPSRTLAAASSASLSRSGSRNTRSEEHTSELQSLAYLVCRLLLEKKKKKLHARAARTNPTSRIARAHDARPD